MNHLSTFDFLSLKSQLPHTILYVILRYLVTPVQSHWDFYNKLLVNKSYFTKKWFSRGGYALVVEIFFRVKIWSYGYDFWKILVRMDLFCIYYDPISHITKNLEGLKVGENRYFGGKRGGVCGLSFRFFW